MESAVAYRQLDPDSSPAVQEEDGTTLTRHGIRESRHAAAAGLGDISLGPLDDEDDTGLLDEEEYDSVPNRGFQFGRAFEPGNKYHKYEPAELKLMESFETLDYKEPQSQIYKKYVAETPEPSSASKWLAFALIGLIVGILVFILKQSIDFFVYTRAQAVDYFMEDNRKLMAWLASCGDSLLLIFASTVLVIFVEPVAGGSGVPEVMGYLNGVRIPKIFNLRTAMVRLLSCISAVGSGMPVGPEGPIIHLGAAMGAGISQGRSKTLGCTTSIFERFRNTQDKREFITCGAAVGMAAAFNAPLGGLLFAMEEVSSFWHYSLTWSIFFGTIISVFVANLFGSAFEHWHYTRPLGTWDKDRSILFHVDSSITFNPLAVPAVVVLGVVGGIAGSLFNALNVTINRLRQRFIVPFTWRRVAEPLLFTLVFSSVAFTAPLSAPCLHDCTSTRWNATAECVKFNVTSPVVTLEPLRRFNCEEGSYNPLASLFLEPGHTVVQHLFSRGADSRHFGYPTIASFGVIYFFFACICAGTAISSGIIIPMLVIGSVIGRMFGLLLVDIFEPRSGTWMDPGVFALIGAGAFFSGVSRLTISLTVVMIELSNDIHLLLPVMLGIMLAKWVADLTTHSLYHALLTLKCVPFLDPDLLIKKPAIYSASDIMTPAVVSLPVKCKIKHILQVLTNTKHNGFPIVIPSSAQRQRVRHMRERGLTLRQSGNRFRGSVAPAGAGVGTAYTPLSAIVTNAVGSYNDNSPRFSAPSGLPRHSMPPAAGPGNQSSAATSQAAAAARSSSPDLFSDTSAGAHVAMRPIIMSSTLSRVDEVSSESLSQATTDRDSISRQVPQTTSSGGRGGGAAASSPVSSPRSGGLTLSSTGRRDEVHTGDISYGAPALGQASPRTSFASGRLSAIQQQQQQQHFGGDNDSPRGLEAQLHGRQYSDGNADQGLNSLISRFGGPPIARVHDFERYTLCASEPGDSTADGAVWRNFKGLVTRDQLMILLQHLATEWSNGMNAEDLATYQALRDLDMKLYANSRRMARERSRRQKQGLSVVDPTGPDAYLALAEDMGLLPHLDRTLDLGPFIDTSAFSVRGDMDLPATHHLFRSAGLRHLVVVNDDNEVVGIITRYNLVGHVIEKRIEAIMDIRQRTASASRKRSD